MRTFNQGHALIIGTGEYFDNAWDTPIARSEAQAVADVLRAPDRAAYPPDQVHTLLGAAASHAAMINALQELAARVDSDSTVLLYLCGHGERTTDDSYAFAAYDTIFESDNLIKANSGLSSHELLVLLGDIRARKLVCIVNACFAGHLGTGFRGTSALATSSAPPIADLSAHVLGSGEGRVLMTASRASQPSYYLFQQPYTFFGEALIEGLQGVGATNSAGYISLYTLYQHIYTRVTTAAAGINCVQEPMLTILQGAGPYPLACHPSTTEDQPEEATRTVHAFWQGIGAGKKCLENECWCGGRLTGPPPHILLLGDVALPGAEGQRLQCRAHQ